MTLNLTVKEITVKSLLSKSGIAGVDYSLNPYRGCSFGCRYCYARFMRRFTGHRESWGEFVDIKVNGPATLERELDRVRRGVVLLSSVTDAYQPVEAERRITRQCLEALLVCQFPVRILTKSPLVRRDTDLFRGFVDIEVGLTVTTDDERVRRFFEPKAPSLGSRIEALKRLHGEGVKTYAFIGPVLPMNPEALAGKLRPHVRKVIIDRMNYTYRTRGIFTRLGAGRWLEPAFVDGIIRRLEKGFEGREVVVC